MYSNNAYNVYTHNSIESSEELTAMLYEGLLCFNAEAKKAIQDGNIEKRIYWISRSISIMTELISSLDMKQGNVSYYLEGLYNYEIQLISEAGNEENIAKLDECSNVFKVLLDTWKETTHVAQ